MASRPIFVPLQDGPAFIDEISIEIAWASGFSVVQKKKNIRSLHEAAARWGYSPLLEISTKSDIVVGQHLSAFHLKIDRPGGAIPLESAYQGSKVFERGGPFIDLYDVDARTAKRDSRLKESGRLLHFEFDGKEFPNTPRTAFYDWLYLKSIYPHRRWLKERLTIRQKFAGFTDIEFNPAKSINCQARSCALFVSLTQRKLLDEVLQSPSLFVDAMRNADRRSLAVQKENALSF